MTPDERKLLTGFLALLVTLGLGYFGFRPLVGDYHQAAIIHQARLREVQQLEARKQTLTALKEQMTTQQAQIDKLLQAVPDSEAYPELLTQLSALANRSGVSLLSVQPARSAVETSAVPTTITLSGNYPKILGFITAVEHNLRPFGLQSVNLVGTSGQQQVNDLTATIQLRAARIANTGGES